MLKLYITPSQFNAKTNLAKEASRDPTIYRNVRDGYVVEGADREPHMQYIIKTHRAHSKDTSKLDIHVSGSDNKIDALKILDV